MHHKETEKNMIKQLNVLEDKWKSLTYISNGISQKDRKTLSEEIFANVFFFPELKTDMSTKSRS